MRFQSYYSDKLRQTIFYLPSVKDKQLLLNFKNNILIQKIKLLFSPISLKLNVCFHFQLFQSLQF
ncbi:hypothetical protein BTTAP_50034 [Brochothrix thermosphacta]|nr:hypothetical protein BTTAP_50034 [Brochothrix thermosphacta]